MFKAQNQSSGGGRWHRNLEMGRCVHALCSESCFNDDRHLANRALLNDDKGSARLAHSHHPLTAPTHGDTFLDHVIIHAKAATAPSPSIAKKKYKAMVPPSGDNGGASGDVYIIPTPTLTTLASISKRVRGQPGTYGRGTWQNGRSAPPTIIHVPLGTVVRELPRDDPRRAKDTWEEAHEGLGVDARRARMLDS
ncbi:hypothetical protein L210DRAFT_2065157 [Boletus edulis BED1]|uniref:Obg domain-containing protein n=1 Tax=Boletus edulis BED1 TaxID=1328754 RepID=A0AAD4GNN8_BOLED|nr:hypothetical protein L210DRAFT_2065157 [Boletus edulis BED1]